MYIRHLTLTDLRSFKQATLDFQYPGRVDSATTLPNINVLLGNNGAGKSTVLRGIALAVLSPVLPSGGFRPYRLVRQTATSRAEVAEVRAEVELHAQDRGLKRAQPLVDNLSTRIKRIHGSETVSESVEPTGHWERMFDERSPAFLVVGYGASRRVEPSERFDQSLRSKGRQIRYERVAGLFEDGVTMTPLGAWLPTFRGDNPGRFKQVVNLMNDLLPDECQFTADTDDGEYVFLVRDVPVPFAALSDGYRAYIGWIADLLYHITMGAPSGAKLVDNKGIVLIDEIDLHLHPDWQRTLVPRLADVLPNMQFVLTTHSPIVVGTLTSANIYVMEQDDEGTSTVTRYTESITGKSADQILLSPYFNLETTRSRQMTQDLATLSRRARSGDEAATLEFMKALRTGLGIATALNDADLTGAEGRKE